MPRIATALRAPTPLSFFIAGLPVPQGNHRTSKRTGKVYETTKGHAEWRDTVATEAMIVKARRGTIAHPVAATLEFYLLRPKRCPTMRAVPSVKPDLSKLVRCVEDGLVAGQLLADDALIVDCTARKRYAIPASQPCGCRVTLTDFTEEG